MRMHRGGHAGCRDLQCDVFSGSSTMGNAIRIFVLAAIVGIAGCASWDSLSSAQKGTAIGAGVDGVTGAAVTQGGVLGTVGGAAVGGVVGHEIGEHRDRNK